MCSVKPSLHLGCILSGSFEILMDHHIMGGCYALMTHKYKGSIVVLSISKSDEPNEEQKEMTSGF